MGDRGNIKVGKVYLYTHWRCSFLKQILQKALKRKQRWNNEPYLTRIIFCEMIEGNVSGESDFGISTEIGDNQDNILEVNCKSQKVLEKTEEGELVKEWTFAEFIGQKFRSE